jgi:hypothetical protein
MELLNHYFFFKVIEKREKGKSGFNRRTIPIFYLIYTSDKQLLVGYAYLSVPPWMKSTALTR